MPPVVPSQERAPAEPRQGLRVALVSDYYYPDLGGMQEHVHNLALELVRRGHAVTVITTAFPAAGADAESGAQSVPTLPFAVVRLGRASGPIIANGSVSRAAVGLGLGTAMRRLLYAQRFDVIHVHAPVFPTLSLLAIRCAPPESLLIGTLHTHFDDSQLLRLLRWPLQRYLDALDGLIAVSATAVTCMQRLGFTCEATIIPNGVDLTYWQGGGALGPWQDGAINLIAQARLEPRNHIGTIVTALRLLAERQPDQPVPRLIVLGEGPQRGELERRSAGLPVHFAGAVLAERADFVATSDIYCFTAAIASHPMALLEGMAAGRPVLAHDIDGVRSLVSDGVEGFVLPLDDPPAYAAALSRLASDPVLRTTMGTAAQARVAAFAWPQITAQIEAFYLSTSARAGAKARG